MIDIEQNLFIIDSKEEYYKTYSKKLKKNGYNTVVINLRDVNKSDCWNFLDYPKKIYSNGNIDLATDFIEKMGHELFYEDNKNSDPFWSNSASDFFSGVVLGLFEDAKENEINLNSVSNVFSVGEKKFGSDTFVKRYFSLKDTTNPAYVCASGTAFAPNETRASILSVAKQKLRVYVSREALANVLAKTSFDFEKLTDKKTAVFIITKDENKTVNIIATMFLQQLYRLILQNKTNVKWNFILDNFDTLYNVSNLVDILSSAVSRNINFYIATRSFDTLRETYGDYIKHIASILTVGSDDITIEKNGNVETVEKGENIINSDLYFKDDVEYPTTVKNQIEVFNLEEFVKSKHTVEMQNMLEENPTKKSDFNVDDLISQIDKRIEELDKKEQEDNKKIDVNAMLDEIIKNIDDKIEDLNQEEKDLTEEQKQENVKKQKFVHSKLQELSSEEYIEFTKNPQPYYEKWKAEYRK